MSLTRGPMLLSRPLPYTSRPQALLQGWGREGEGGGGERKRPWATSDTCVPIQQRQCKLLVTLEFPITVDPNTALDIFRLKKGVYC